MVARAPGREVRRRRDQPARPDEAADRDAGAPGGRQPPRARHASSGPTTAGCASARSSATPRSPPHETVRTRLRRARARHPRRRLGAAAQPRHHRRQPPPAHPLPLLLRHHPGLQPAARPAPAAAPIGGNTRQHAVLGDERALHRHQPLRHERGAAGARRHGGDGDARRAEAAPSDRRLPPLAGRRRRSGRPRSRTGEMVTAVTLPAPLAWRTCVPQGARPRVVRLRHRVAGRRRRRRARCGSPSAVWRTSRGGWRRRRRTWPRRRTWSSLGRRRPSTMRSSCRWRADCSRRCCARQESPTR